MPNNIQEALYDFDATIKAHPEYTEAQILQKFPEFGGDVKKLHAAYDYSATLRSGKYKNPSEFNNKFPEFFGSKDVAVSNNKTQIKPTQIADEFNIPTPFQENQRVQQNQKIQAQDNRPYPARTNNEINLLGYTPEKIENPITETDNQNMLSANNKMLNEMPDYSKSFGSKGKFEIKSLSGSDNSLKITPETFEQKKNRAGTVEYANEKALNDPLTITQYSINKNLEDINKASDDFQARLKQEGKLFVTDTEHGGEYIYSNKEDGIKADNYLLSTKILQDANRTLNAPQKGGYFKGILERSTDVDFWRGGMAEISKNSQIKNVLDKIDEGIPFEKLDDSEKTLLNAVASKSQAELLRKNNTSGAYGSGKQTVDVAKFIVELYAGGGAGKLALSGGEKALLKLITEKISSKALQGVASLGTKAVSRLGASVIGASFSPTTIANTQKGTQGNIIPSIDENRQIEYAGRSDIKTLPQAYGTAVRDQAKEYATEMSGGSLNVAGKFAKAMPFVDKFIGEIGETAIGKLGSKIAGNKVVKLLRTNPTLRSLAINNGFGEWNEELDGALLDHLWGVEDFKKSFWNWDAQASLLLTLAPMQIAGIAGNAVTGTKINGNYAKSDKAFSNVLKAQGYADNDILEIKQTMQSVTPKTAGTQLHSILGNNATEEEYKKGVSYIFDTARYNAYQGNKEANDDGVYTVEDLIKDENTETQPSLNPNESNAVNENNLTPEQKQSYINDKANAFQEQAHSELQNSYTPYLTEEGGEMIVVNNKTTGENYVVRKGLRLNDDGTINSEHEGTIFAYPVAADESGNHTADFSGTPQLLSAKDLVINNRKTADQLQEEISGRVAEETQKHITAEKVRLGIYDYQAGNDVIFTPESGQQLQEGEKLTVTEVNPDGTLNIQSNMGQSVNNVQPSFISKVENIVPQVGEVAEVLPHIQEMIDVPAEQLQGAKVERQYTSDNGVNMTELRLIDGSTMPIPTEFITKPSEDNTENAVTTPNEDNNLSEEEPRAKSQEPRAENTPAYPLKQDGSVDFSQMNEVQTINYIREKHGDKEADNAIFDTEKSIRKEISDNIRKIDKFNAEKFAEQKKAKTLQERADILDKQATKLTSLQQERADLDARLKAVLDIKSQEPRAVSPLNPPQEDLNITPKSPEGDLKSSQNAESISPIDAEIEQQDVNTTPTEAQKEAGNYKKGHVTVQGMDITIENPKGSVRRGVDEDGKAWEHEMKSHYGYFLKTEGKDGDHIDVFVGNNPESEKVFVIDQNKPPKSPIGDLNTPVFDESKVMLGYNTTEEAKQAYLENYDKDWKGFGAITEVPVEDFKKWLYDGAKQRKPFSEYKETPEPIETAEQNITPTLSKGEVEKVAKPTPKKETPVQQRLRALGDYVNVEDYVLRSIAGGLKFKWNDAEGTKGLGAEFRYAESERKARFNIISEKDGVTPEQFAHNIWELPENEIPGLHALDTQEILNTVHDVTRMVTSTKQALEQAEAMHAGMEQADTPAPAGGGISNADLMAQVPFRQVNPTETITANSKKFDEAQTKQEKYVAGTTIIRNLEAEFGLPESEIHQTHKDVINQYPNFREDHKQFILDGKATGFWFAGKLVIDLQAVPNAKELIKTVLHENAHRTADEVLTRKEVIELLKTTPEEIINKNIPSNLIDEPDAFTKASEYVAYSVEKLLDNNTIYDIYEGNIDYADMPEQKQQTIQPIIKYLQDEYNDNSRQRQERRTNPLLHLNDRRGNSEIQPTLGERTQAGNAGTTDGISNNGENGRVNPLLRSKQDEIVLRNKYLDDGTRLDEKDIVKNWTNFSKSIKKYLSKDNKLKEFPIFVENGFINKNLLGGLINDASPNRIVQSKKGIEDVIDFLQQLNKQLNDEEINNTIDYFKDVKNAYDVVDNQENELFSSEKKSEFEKSNLNDKLDILNSRSKHILGVLDSGMKMTDVVHKSYMKILDRYVYLKETPRFRQAENDILTPDGEYLLESAKLPFVDTIKTKEEIADYNARVEVLNNLYKNNLLSEDNAYDITEDYTLEKYGENRTFDEIKEEKLDELDNLADEDLNSGDENPLDFLDELKFDVTKMTIEDLVRQAKGVTDNIATAGYILPDGDMLDFSGGMGERYEDHRQLGIPYKENIQSPTEAMERFKNTTSAVRIDGDKGSIDINNPITNEQKSIISKIIKKNTKDYSIDLSDGDRRLSITNAPLEYAIEKIDEFYKNETLGTTRNEQIRFRQAETTYEQQLNDIRSNALADGTFMLAKTPTNSPSRGELRPTNLTEKQWLQVRTPQFKEWFGDWENDPENASKVVDANGEPMVVYHGTGSDFDIYDLKKSGRTDGGYFGKSIYMSENPLIAESYSSPRTIKEYPSIMPLYTQIKNPYYIIDGVFQNGIPNKGKTIIETYGRKDKLMSVIGAKLKKDLIKNGFDGVLMKTDDELVQIISFSPNQIKSATGNYGDFSADNNDIRFRQTTPLGFYSTVENALDNIPQEKGTKDQFRAMLLNNGAKQAEMDWMGFDELPEKLTKADIQNWIDENRIEVEELEKSKESSDIRYEYSDELTDAAAERKSELEEAIHNFNKLIRSGIEGDEYFNKYEEISEKFNVNPLEDAEQELGELVNNIENYLPQEIYYGEDTTKFSQYVLPGGENYKELLLTMPREYTFEQWYNENKQNYGEKRDFDELTQDFKNVYLSEYKNRTKNTPSGIAHTKGQNEFNSSHFSEPNILAHVRFDEREVNGDKILFIEEIQSDWAQKGKKEGFNQKLKVNKEHGFKELPEGYSTRIRKDGKIVLFNGDEIIKEFDSRDDVVDWFEKKQAAPNMPFKKTDQWVNLSIRRMMKYAVDNGFNRIAWTTGEQQAERYDLSKQVKEIIYRKDGENNYYINVKGENSILLAKHNQSEKDLEENIGKEITNKIVTGEGKISDNGDTKSLSGIDLKVGGEGMKAFYNQIVPKAFERLGKPFGAKVEQIEQPETGTQLSIPITDKLREIATEQGMPLFRQQEEQPLPPKPAYTQGDDILEYAKKVAEWNKIKEQRAKNKEPRTKSQEELNLENSINILENLNKSIEDFENKPTLTEKEQRRLNYVKLMHDNVLQGLKSNADKVLEKPISVAVDVKPATGIELQAEHNDYVKARKYQKAQEIKHEKYISEVGKDIPNTDEYGTELAPEETEDMINRTRQITADIEAVNDIQDYNEAPNSSGITDLHQFMLEVSRQRKEDLPKIRKTAADIVDYLRNAMGRDIVQMMSLRDFNTLINRLETATSVGSLKKAVKDANFVIQNIVVRKNNNVIKGFLSGKVLNTYLIHQLSEKAEQNGETADDDYRKLMQGINTYNTYFKIQQQDKRGVQIYKNVDERTRTMMQFIRDNVKQEHGEFLVTSKDKLDEIEAAAREKVEALQTRLALRELTEAQKKSILNEISDEDWKFTAVKMLEMLDQLSDKQAEVRDLQLTDAQEFTTEYKYEAIFRERQALEKMQMDIIRDFSDVFNNGRGRLVDWQQAQEKRWEEQLSEALQAIHDKEVESQADAKNLHQNTPEHIRRILATNPIKKWYYAPQASFEFMLKWIDRNNPIGTGKFYHRWMSGEDGVVAAENKLYSGFNAYKAGLQQEIKDIFGSEYTLEKFAKDTDMDSGTTIDYVELKDGEKVMHKDVPMTKGELMYVWLTWQHNNGREKLEAMEMTQADIDKYAKVLGDKYIQFGKWVSDDYLNALREDKYNKTHVDVFGTSMGMVERYFPLRYAETELASKTDVDGINYQMPSTITNAIITRTKNKKQIDLSANFLDILIEHGEKMESWNAYARLRQDLNKLLQNKEFKNMLNANDPILFDYFQKAANIAVDANQPPPTDVERIAMSTVRKLQGGAIALRLNTALKQSSAFAAYLTYSLNPKYLGYLANNTANPKRMTSNYKWALENLPGFAERVNSGSFGNEKLKARGWENAIQRNAQDKILGKFSKVTGDTAEKITRWGMKPNVMIDAYFFSTGSRAIYEYQKERYEADIKASAEYKALDNIEDEVKRTAEQAEMLLGAKRKALFDASNYSNKTAQSGSNAYLAPIQKSNTALSQSLTAFMNANFGLSRMVSEGLLQVERAGRQVRKLTETYSKETQDSSEYEKANEQQKAEMLEDAESRARREVRNASGHAALNLVYAGLISNMIFQLFDKELWGAMFGGGDDHEKWKRRITAAWQSPINNMLGGNLALGGLEYLSGENNFMPSNLMSSETEKALRDGKTAFKDGFNAGTAEWAIQYSLKFGYGLNVETILNIYKGIDKGIAKKGGAALTYQYITNVPKTIRVETAEIPRENETQEQYMERVRLAMDNDKKFASSEKRLKKQFDFNDKGDVTNYNQIDKLVKDIDKQLKDAKASIKSDYETSGKNAELRHTYTQASIDDMIDAETKQKVQTKNPERYTQYTQAKKVFDDLEALDKINELKTDITTNVNSKQSYSAKMRKLQEYTYRQNTGDLWKERPSKEELNKKFEHILNADK